MMDITKNEFWEKEESDNCIKRTVIKNKFLSISFFIFGICITANIALMYSFFKILSNL